jgi:hypothetical protein
MFDNLDDPKKQMLMAMAFGLLGGQGGKGVGGFARDLGQAGLLGMKSYTLANEDKRRNQMAQQEAKSREMQMAEAQRGQDFNKALGAG